MHGQSEYTDNKQKHLLGILTANAYGCDPRRNGKVDWAHQEVICIDCTSGNGRSEDGKAGSPLIINEWAVKYYGDNFRQLCCERVPTSYVRLRQEPLARTDVILGDYQRIVPQWLDALDLKRPALGFIYCDPNGAKDLIDGLDFFRWLTQQRNFQYLDLIFHWSMNAYSRNAGVGNGWAQNPILRVVDDLANLKPYTFMREPLSKWQWVFMQVIKTSKVKPAWKSERILPYSEWLFEYSDRFQL